MNSYNTTCSSFDMSEYPIIKVKIHPLKISVDDIKESVDVLMKILKKTTGPFVLYVDATEAPWLKNFERETTYTAIKYIQEEFKERYLAQYFLINNPAPAIRILIALIRGFGKKEVPQRIFTCEIKALKIINTDLERFYSRSPTLI